MQQNLFNSEQSYTADDTGLSLQISSKQYLAQVGGRSACINSVWVARQPMNIMNYDAKMFLKLKVVMNDQRFL